MTTLGLNKLVDTLIQWLNHQREPSDVPLCDFERIRYELRPCDVLLIEGRSHISNVIRMITASPWTHAALYVGKLHDIEDPKVRSIVAEHFNGDTNTPFILESVLGKGTVVTPLDAYERDHIRICRPKGLADNDAQEVIRYAVSRLGTDYDVRQIFDLARFLFPWFILPKKWRSSLFQQHPGRPTRTVCSSMIAEAFGFIQFPILPLVKRTGSTGVQLFRRNPRLCVPRDFDYSPYFEIIKYPFIDFSVHTSYRLLPWKGSGVLIGEEADLYMSTHKEPQSRTEQPGTSANIPQETDQIIPDINTAPFDQNDQPNSTEVIKRTP